MSKANTYILKITIKTNKSTIKERHVKETQIAVSIICTRGMDNSLVSESNV